MRSIGPITTRSASEANTIELAVSTNMMKHVLRMFMADSPFVLARLSKYATLLHLLDQSPTGPPS